MNIKTSTKLCFPYKYGTIEDIINVFSDNEPLCFICHNHKDSWFWDFAIKNPNKKWYEFWKYGYEMPIKIPSVLYEKYLALWIIPKDFPRLNECKYGIEDTLRLVPILKIPQNNMEQLFNFMGHYCYPLSSFPEIEYLYLDHDADYVYWNNPSKKGIENMQKLGLLQ